MSRGALPRSTGTAARWLSAALGVWLMAAPAVLGYTGAADTSDRIVGPIVASISICAAWGVLAGLRWLNLGFSAWLLLAPWVLGFPGDAAANSALAGLALGVLSLPPLRSRHRFGGGWRALTA